MKSTAASIQPKPITFVWASPELLSDLIQLETDSGTGWTRPKSFFEESLKHERVLLARDGERAVAYLLYQVIWGNVAFLSLLVVLPGYRKKGIATSMINYLEERFIDLGFKSYVTSTEAINPNTKTFFTDLGFSRIGDLAMQNGIEIFFLKRLV